MSDIKAANSLAYLYSIIGIKKFLKGGFEQWIYLEITPPKKGKKDPIINSIIKPNMWVPEALKFISVYENKPYFFFIKENGSFIYCGFNKNKYDQYIKELEQAKKEKKYYEIDLD